MSGIRKERKFLGEEKWAEYQKLRQYHKALKSERKNCGAVGNWRRRAKKELIEYKGGRCEMCGYGKPIPNAYDFHHKDGNTKEFGIGTGDCKSLARMKVEADKCLLLCRNCHAEVHSAEYEVQVSKTMVKRDEKIKEIETQIERLLAPVREAECSN